MVEAGEDNRSVQISFSSETPVPRGWMGYDEVLSHDDDAVDLSWLNSGRAPLLKDHRNSVDSVLGVIERAWVENRTGKMIARFSDDDAAELVLSRVKDGTLQNVSVGYRITELVREEDENGITTKATATKWTPYEVSMVAIPADQSDSIGVGRSADNRDASANGDGETLVITSFQRAIKMDNDNQVEETQASTRAADQAPPVDVEAVRSSAADAERKRCGDIMKLATSHNKREMGEQAIDHNVSVDQFRGLLVAAIDSDEVKLEAGAGDLGLSRAETRQYSFINAMRGILNKNVSGLERECSEEIGKRLDSDSAGVFIPEDMMVSRDLGEFDRDRHVRAMMSGMIGQRALSVGTASAGGDMVGTDHLGASFIEIYRNAMLVRQMGARRLTGLTGNVAIPKQTGASSAGWISTEGAEPAESDLTVGQLTLTPNEIGTRVDVTRLLLNQSDPSINALIRDDLALGVALAMDDGAINGSGASGQPTGIRNTSGIGDVDLGANGAAPTWADIVEFVTDVMGANALRGSLGWIINSPTWGKLMTTEKASGTAQYLLQEPGVTMVGHQVGVTEQLPSNLTKGSGVNLSAAVFGNFADLIIAEWGVMELLQDPYTQGGNTHRFRVLHLADVGVRHAGSFAVSDEIDNA